MELYPYSERRRVDRRQNDRRQHATTESVTEQVERRRAERRQGERRRHQRRQFVRVVYPPDAAPEVLNANFRITNISQQGIMFACQSRGDECTQPITIGSIRELKIRFHDQEVLDVNVKILRCQYEPDSHENVYAGFIENGIPYERIGKEEAYLLRLFVSTVSVIVGLFERLSLRKTLSCSAGET
jgi:hypothetical protein